MKRVTLLTGILTLAFLLSHGVALAQETRYEIFEGEPGQEGTERIEIYRTVTPETDVATYGPTMGFGPGMHGMTGVPRCDLPRAWGAHGAMGGPCGPCCCAMMPCGPGFRMGHGPGMQRMMGERGRQAFRGPMFPGPGGSGPGNGFGDGGLMGLLHGRLQKVGCICQYERYADELGLSKDQLADLKDLRVASRKAAIQATADIQIAHVEMDEILSASSPDLVKVKAKISEIASLREKMALASVSVLQKAQKILTKEQLEKFRDCMKGMRETKQKRVKKKTSVIEKPTEKKETYKKKIIKKRATKTES